MELTGRGLQERWLESFLAIVAAGGYEQAERALQRPANTLKGDIKNLEAEVGVELLQGRPLKLTAAGEWLLPQIAALSRRMKRIRDDSKALRHGRLGTVRVRGYPVHVAMVFADATRTFRERAGEDVTVEFEEATSFDIVLAERDLYAPVSKGIVDIAIGGQKRNGLRFLPLYKTPLVAISYRAEEERVWAGKDLVAVDELRSVPLIGIGPGTFCYPLLREHALIPNAERDASLRVKVTSPGALIRFIQAGLGVGVMTDDLARNWTARGDAANAVLADRVRSQVGVKDLNGQPLVLTVGAHFIGRDDCAPALKTFIEVLEEVAHARHHASGTGPWDGCRRSHK